MPADSTRTWVDAGACPGVIKDIVFRAAERIPIAVTLVANQWLRILPSRHIHAIQVPGGPDVADDEIVQRMQPGDLVVTHDIPLAAKVLEKGGVALNPCGELYTADNMAERLSMRTHGRAARLRCADRRPARIACTRLPGLRQPARSLARATPLSPDSSRWR